MFFTELLTLCEGDDATLQKLPCYKSYTNLTDLRKSALRALSACHYIPECRDKIFNVLYKVLNTVPVSQIPAGTTGAAAANASANELVETSFECLRKFIVGREIDLEMVRNMIQNVIDSLNQNRVQLQDQRNALRHTNVINRLYYMAQLFPTIFNDKVSEQLLSLLKKWLEMAIFAFAQLNQGGPKLDGQQPLKVAAAYVRSGHQRNFLECPKNSLLKEQKRTRFPPCKLMSF